MSMQEVLFRLILAALLLLLWDMGFVYWYDFVVLAVLFAHYKKFYVSTRNVSLVGAESEAKSDIEQPIKIRR